MIAETVRDIQDQKRTETQEQRRIGTDRDRHGQNKRIWTQIDRDRLEGRRTLGGQGQTGDGHFR